MDFVGVITEEFFNLEETGADMTNNNETQLQRIQALKKAIENHTYVINYHRIVEKLANCPEFFAIAVKK